MYIECTENIRVARNLRRLKAILYIRVVSSQLGSGAITTQMSIQPIVNISVISEWPGSEL
jgi:hypothetical protein